MTILQKYFLENKMDQVFCFYLNSTLADFVQKFRQLFLEDFLGVFNGGNLFSIGTFCLDRSQASKTWEIFKIVIMVISDLY